MGLAVGETRRQWGGIRNGKERLSIWLVLCGRRQFDLETSVKTLVVARLLVEAVMKSCDKRRTW